MHWLITLLMNAHIVARTNSLINPTSSFLHQPSRQRKGGSEKERLRLLSIRGSSICIWHHCFSVLQQSKSDTFSLPDFYDFGKKMRGKEGGGYSAKNRHFCWLSLSWQGLDSHISAKRRSKHFSCLKNFFFLRGKATLNKKKVFLLALFQ